MRKILLAILVLVLFVSTAYAENGGVTLGFLVRKEYETQQSWNIEVFFTPYEENQRADRVVLLTERHAYTESEISFDEDLGTPQLGFAVWTKNFYNLGLRFKFSLMVNTEDNDVVGGYRVRIYKPKYYNVNNDRAAKSTYLTDLETLTGWDDLVVNTNTVDSKMTVSCLVDFNDRNYTDPENGSFVKTGPFTGPTFKNITGEKGVYFDNGREGWLYPIAFNFSGFDYAEGDYSATITVEVISNS